MVDQSLLDSFHLMWDNFPDPVILTDKQRIVHASNPVAKSRGREVGVRCIDLGSPEAHRGCRANHALKNQQPECMKKKSGAKDMLLYWLPVNGYPDYVVHVSIGAVSDALSDPTTVNIENA